MERGQPSCLGAAPGAGQEEREFARVKLCVRGSHTVLRGSHFAPISPSHASEVAYLVVCERYAPPAPSGGTPT